MISAFLPLLFWWTLMVVPVAFILKRSGSSAWWNVTQALPLFGSIILLWVLAFKRWPGLEHDLTERFE